MHPKSGRPFAERTDHQNPKLIAALIVALLGFLILLTTASSTYPAQASAPISQTPPSTIDAPKLVNMYFRDRSEPAVWQELGYDLPEAVVSSDVAGYLAYVPNVPMTPDQYLLARSRNIHVRVVGPVSSSQPDWGECYRDYNAMLTYLNNLAAQYPNIVEVTDIGDTWCKLNPGQCSYNGFEMWRVRLTNRSIPGSKPKFHVVAAHHAREIATPELALQWVQELVSGYGNNADATWLLDNREIYIVPVGNPDGWYRAATDNANKRKNDHTNPSCGSSSSWGVDLNRNYDIAWSLPGASSNPCDPTYYGTAPNSEPETQALIGEYNSVLPNSMITLHTYGPYILYPWGYAPYNQTRPVDKPAYDAISWNMGRMTGTPREAVGNDVLYQVSGAVDDWTYDRLGIPSFTAELGPYQGFNTPCSVLPGIVNTYKPMLTYLAKATGTLTQTTFMRGFGPSPTNLSATVTGTTLDVSAVISANYGTVNGAIYSLDILPEDGNGTAMSLSGQNATASVDVSALPTGRHTVYVQGKTAYNYFGNSEQWGIVSALFFTTTGQLTPTATPPPTSTPSPTATSVLPTSTIPPTGTVVPTLSPSSTSISPTDTPLPGVTNTAIPPTSTPPPCDIYFEDVPPDHGFYPFIRCLYCRNVVTGYADGTFRPNNPVTRGQLAKIVSNSAGFNETVSGQTFEDVTPTHTFYVWIERLTSRGYMTGYVCGGPGEPCATGRPYFRPYANATRGQTSKIVSNAAMFTDPPSGQTFEDVPPNHTFYDFIQRLASRNVMQGYECGRPGEPCIAPENRPYFRPGNDVTRGQSAKIVANTFFPDCQTP